MVKSTIMVMVFAVSLGADQPPAAPVPGFPTPVLVSTAELAPAVIPTYGPVFVVWPAHRLAMAEAGQSLVESDPLVGRAAELLERLTAVYVEDAPRIAELTIRAGDAIRRTGGVGSPFAMIDDALRAPRPPGIAASVPRRYEHFAARYRAEHAKATPRPAAKSPAPPAQPSPAPAQPETPAEPTTPPAPGAP